MMMKKGNETEKKRTMMKERKKKICFIKFGSFILNKLSYFYILSKKKEIGKKGNLYYAINYLLIMSVYINTLILEEKKRA
jgi:hypothetical protein